ncbi:hypothetical protein D3C72_743910 [compost metagenome]
MDLSSSPIVFISCVSCDEEFRTEKDATKHACPHCGHVFIDENQTNNEGDG